MWHMLSMFIFFLVELNTIKFSTNITVIFNHSFAHIGLDVILGQSGNRHAYVSSWGYQGKTLLDCVLGQSENDMLALRSGTIRERHVCIAFLECHRTRLYIVL